MPLPENTPTCRKIMKKDTISGLSILFGAYLVFSIFIGPKWTVGILQMGVDFLSVGFIIGIIRSFWIGILSKQNALFLFLGLVLSLSCSIFGHIFIKTPFTNSEFIKYIGIAAVLFLLIKLK
jgi:hypothetical protein